MDKVEQLYKNFGILADAKDKIGEHQAEFLEIVAAVKGSSNEKKLASQFIARFYKHFPNLTDQAIDALLDLCEDNDVSIRKQAIKDLPSFCRDNPEHVPKIADVLAQLLQVEDASELSTVHSSLITLFKIDAKGTLRGLFAQIVNGDDIIRERALKFLGSKLQTLNEVLITKETEECFLEESKKVLLDVTAAEFTSLMQILSSLKISKTLSGQQQLAEILVEQAELDKDFEFTDSDIVDRLMQCGKQVLPFLSTYVPSTRFVVYMCRQVLPVLSEVKGPSTDDAVDVQLELLKLFAELSPHCQASVDGLANFVLVVYNKLLEFMPLPPTASSAPSIPLAVAATKIDANNADNSPAHITEDPKLEFSCVECLMYAFHQLGRKCPEFLTAGENADLLKDFKLRLQYFARGIQVYIKKLREALQGKKAEELKSDENKLKVMALKTTSNINTLIRDLFHSPPSYKSTISLSWKPVILPQSTAATTAAAAAAAAAAGGSLNKQVKVAPSANNGASGIKRPAHTPITFETEDVAVSKPAKKMAVANAGAGRGVTREIYSPPSGKYSQKVKNFEGGGQGQGQNRGKWRGFGSRGRGRSGNRGRVFAVQ